VLEGTLILFWSKYVVGEIRRIPEKPTPRRLGVDGEKIESLISRLQPVVRLLENAPAVFDHPVDPKDSHYVNLAVAADAKLIVSRDKHLLNLTNPLKPDAADFMRRFPTIIVLQPDQLLKSLRRK